mmetsp:Transcript_27007/g.58942  ORF Transcript_27007/g.58942 Transcript_27007/m.58942 type:complete len:292 (+) Transcript_27007:720-1595(+)
MQRATKVSTYRPPGTRRRQPQEECIHRVQSGIRSAGRVLPHPADESRCAGALRGGRGRHHRQRDRAHHPRRAPHDALVLGHVRDAPLRRHHGRGHRRLGPAGDRGVPLGDARDHRLHPARPRHRQAPRRNRRAHRLGRLLRAPPRRRLLGAAAGGAGGRAAGEPRGGAGHDGAGEGGARAGRARARALRQAGGDDGRLARRLPHARRQARARAAALVRLQARGHVRRRRRLRGGMPVRTAARRGAASDRRHGRARGLCGDQPHGRPAVGCGREADFAGAPLYSGGELRDLL